MMHNCLNARLFIITILGLILSTGVAFGATGFTGDSTINSCETKSYTLSLQNTAGNPLTDLVLTAKLANLTGFSYVNGTASIDINGGGAFCTVNPNVSGSDLIWDIDSTCPSTPFTLGNGDTLNISFDLSTDCSAVSGSLNAQVDYQILGAPMMDNTAVLNIQVNPGAVTIKKTPNVIPQVIGQDVTWTLTVENTGFGVIKNVEVTDELDVGLAYVSSTQSGNNSGQVTTWTSAEYPALASMNPGDKLTMDITATVISCDNLDNKADARFGCAPSPAGTCFNTAVDGGTANASVQRIVRTPNITFTPPDINFTYCADTETVSFAITNIGDGFAYDVYTIVDFSNFTVSNVSAGAVYNAAQGRFELTAPLAPGGTYNLSFDLTYNSWCGGSFPSTSLLWQELYKDECGQEFYPPVELSAINAPALSSGLSVSKSGAPSQVEIGDPVTYTINSSYTGQTTCGSPSGSVGLITVVDTIPNGLTVTDAGGGVWAPGGDGTGGTITWTYTPPASLNTTITVQVPDVTQCETYCNTLFTNSITASGIDCCGCVLSASDSQTTAIECAEGVTSDKTSSSPTERCMDTTYTNTYSFSGSSTVVLSDLTFTEEAELQQVYVSGSLSVTLDAADITGSVLPMDNTPGGGLVLDFSGAGSGPMAGKILTITYDLTATENTIAACSGSTFYSWSSLDIGPSGSSCLADGIIHETTEVSVGSPGMALNISGLGQIYHSCETKTITMTLSQTSNFNPKDVKLKLEGLNYFVVDPESVDCDGSVDPDSCTPVIDGGGDYIWTFGDKFNANGANAVLTMDVQKRCTGTGDLTAIANFDDACTDDATSDELCSVVATETPVLLLSGDLLIEKTPETYFATTNTVQWEIYVTNRGTGTAYNVWVDDVLGSGLLYEHGVTPVVVDKITGVTINDSVDHNGGAINGASIEIAEMAAGERRQITFIAKQIDCNNLTNDVAANWGCIGVNCQTDVIDSSVVQIPAPNLINTNTVTPAGGIDACEVPKGFITLRNAGQVYTYNLQVTETLPAGLSYITDSTRWRLNGGAWNGPDGSYDPNSTISPLVWTSTEISALASAAPGDTIEIEFDMAADCPFAGGDIKVATQYENPCADVFNTSDSTFAVTFNEPDISIVKTRVNEPVGCNQAVSWTIDVTNNSGYTLDTIWVEDTLDPAYTWTGNAGDGTYSVDNGTRNGQIVEWELDDVPHGTTVTLTIDATTDSSPCSPDLDNTVIAWWGCGATDDSSATKPGVDELGDTLCLNGTGVQDVRTETRQPDLSFLSINVSPSSIDSCDDSTTLTVVIENTGPVDASDVDLQITLPLGLTYNAGTSESGLGVDDTVATAGIADPFISGNTLTWYNVGDKGNNIADTINADGGNDTLVLKFAVQSSCYVTDNLNFNLRYYDCCGDNQYNTTSQQSLTALFPSLNITKTPTTGQVGCGGQQSWTIDVTNNGTGNAQVVRVEDTLGLWIDVDLGASTAGLTDMGVGVYGWEFNNLAASGGTQSFTFVGTLNPEGSHNQNDCTTALRQNNVQAIWACGTAGDAIDTNPTTTSDYTCENGTPASAPTATLELPNLVVTSITPSISCTTGDGVFDSTITVRVTNIGDGDTSGLFTVEVTDGKGWTGTGTYSNPIAAGAFADVTINTSTWGPTCQSCGTPYSFLATVDLNNDICECNETDNVSSSATTYATLPDLEVNSITPSCSGDGLSQVVVNIGNVGCTNASSSFILHLEDNQGNSDDITVNSLNSGANTNITFTNWPTACSPATVNFTATVDNDDNICECNSANSLSQAYSNPSADLTVSTITPSTTCAADGSVSGAIEVQISNNGNGDINSDFRILADDGQGWTSELWYQTDLKGTLPLESGDNATISFNWTRGFTTNPQVCSFPTLSVTVDSQLDICECNSGNNTDTTSYSISMPDLEVTAVTPATGCPLSDATVSVANTGCGDAADVVVRLTSDCGLVFDDQVINLAAGGTQNLNFASTTDATSCNCNFSASIDPDAAICELDGTNNTGTSSSTLTIPDLEVNSITPTCSGDGLSRIVVNIGNTSCGDASSPFTLYLEDDLGNSDTITVPSLSGGANTDITFTNWPTACSPATVNFTATVDYNNNICEWDESANSLSLAYANPSADLTVSNITPSATCAADGSVSGAIEVQISNNGNGDITSDFRILADDGQGWTSELWYQTDLKGTLPLESGDNATISFNWTRGFTADPQVCSFPTLSVTVDSQLDICECNSGNNTDTTSYSLSMPDLELTAITPGTGCPLPGTTVSVANTGCGDASNVVVRLTSDCGLVFADQVINLAAGDSQNLVMQFSSSFNNCTCNFTALIDPDTAVCELDGTNNSGTSTSALDIPDLEVLSSNVQIASVEDGRYRVSGEVTLVNNGCGSALTNDIPMRFSIHDASGCGGSQITSFNQSFTGVNLAGSGGTQTFTLTPREFDVDACTQAGVCQYSINIETDYGDAHCEWDNTDNALCSNIPVSVPDLTITGVVPSLTCDNNQKTQGTVTVDVANNGCGDVLGAVVDLTSNCGTQYESQQINLSAGTAGNVVFQISNTPTNCLDFTATIDSANSIDECSGDNNELTGSTSITCESKEIIIDPPHLTLTKTNEQNAVLPGSIVEFSIRITNTGSVDAVNLEIRDTLPTAMLYAPGTSTLDGSLIADPVGERILTWTVPLVGAGKSVDLTYRTVVKSDAKPGHHTNTAYIPGRQSASASVFVNDPDEAQCCLQLEKKMVSHDIWPEAIRVEPDLYFQTDMAMFASAEFVRLNNELGSWLETEGLDHDPTELVTGIYRRMVRQADWYAHFNLGNVTMGSGLGLSMEKAPDVIVEAEKSHQKPSDIIAAKLARWAGESGLDEPPAVTPLLIEYYGAAPFYANTIESGDRAWDSHDRDMSIVPSAWGMTLLRQSQAIQGRLKENNFMRQVTTWQMVQKIKWVRQNLTRTVSTPVETSYLPHSWSMTSGESKELLTLTDDSSHLLDQASALWGLSAMRAAFKQNSAPQPEELEELIEIVWLSLENLHLDQDSGVYIDNFTFESDADDQDEKTKQTTDHYRRVQPASLMTLALALENLIQNNDDLAIASEARDRLKELQSFVANKMVDEQGAAIAYDLETGSEVTNEHTLLNQFALLRILLIQPPANWFQQLSGNKLDIDQALKMFDFAENNLWDNRYGIYRDNAQWGNLDQYSPFDIGTVVGTLRELVQHAPDNQRITIMNRLTATFEKLVNRSEIQLTYMRRNDPERPLPASIETGRKREHPLPLPPRRNNISEGQEQDLMDLAPVMIRGINLSLKPAELQGVTGEKNMLAYGDDEVNTHPSTGMKQRPALTPRQPFHTATGSLGSRQLLEASTILSQAALKTDDAYLFDPALGKHFATNLAELTRAGLIRLTMHSGNGMPLRYAKSLDFENKDLKKSLQDLFDTFARQEGLEETPVVSNPIALEYSYGSPQYRDGLNGGWEERLSSPMVSIPGLAQTMLHQLQFIHLARTDQTPAQNDLDRYLASIAELQVKAKVEFFKELMTQTQGRMPETVRLVVDSYGYPLEVEIENPDGALLTQVSLLQAFGELAFMSSDEYKMFTDGQALVDMGQSLFEDQWTRTMAVLDMNSPRLESQEDIGLALDAIARLHQIIPEGDIRKKNLEETGNRLAQWIMAEQSDHNGRNGSFTKGKNQLLVDNSANIIGLLHWYDITKSESLRTAALEIYKDLIQDSWDPDLGIFHNDVDQTFLQNTGIQRYKYSDLDISLTLSALIRVLPHLESSAQSKLVDRLIVFGNELLEGIDLEVDLFENNRFDGKKYDIELIRGVDLLVTDRENIYPNESVTFSIHVKNSCFDIASRTGPLNRLTVRDQLPTGMRYISGSSRIDKQPIKPIVTDSGELSWHVNGLEQEEEFTITFDARVLEEVQLGDDYNVAWAEGWMKDMDSLKPEQQQWSCQTGEDRLKHTAGPMATIKGRVFIDTDQGGQQGATETGLKGISVLLDGHWKRVSEGDGDYQYDFLRPGSYDIRLDWASIPDDIMVISDPAKNVILEEGQVGVFNIAVLKTHNIEAAVYHDENNNGRFDAGEKGVPAIKIGLKNSDRSAYSAEDGFVRIDSIPVEIPIELIILKEQPYWDQQQWEGKNIRLTPWQEAQE